MLTLAVQSLRLEGKIYHRMWSQTLTFSSVKANAASTLRRSALTSSQRGNRGELLSEPRRLASEVKGSLELEVWKPETSQEWSGSIDTHRLCALRWMVWMLDGKGCLGSPIYTQILYIRTSIYFTSLNQFWLASDD